MKEESGEKKTPQGPEKKSEDSPVQGKQKALKFEEALNQFIGNIKKNVLEYKKAEFQHKHGKAVELPDFTPEIENIKIQNLAVIFTLNDNGQPHWYSNLIQFGKQEVCATDTDLYHMICDAKHIMEAQNMITGMVQGIKALFLKKPEKPNETNMASFLIQRTAQAVVYALQEEMIKQKTGGKIMDPNFFNRGGN